MHRVANNRSRIHPAKAGSHILLVVLATGVPLFAQEPSAPQVPSIVTSGEAVVRRAPDQAMIYAAVETRARSPRDAQRQNADLMTPQDTETARVSVNCSAKAQTSTPETQPVARRC